MKPLPAPKTNKLGSHSLHLFAIKFFTTAATFLVVYYFSHHLPEGSYGTYQQAWTQLAFFNAFAGLGIASLVFSYTPARLASIIRSLSLKTYIGMSAMVIVCAITFAALQSHSTYPLLLFSLFFIAYVLCYLFETTLTALQQFTWLPWLSLLYSIAFCWLHYRSLQNGYDMHMLFTKLLWLLLLRLAVYLVIFYAFFKKEHPGDERFDAQTIRSLWKHLYFFEASQVLMVYLDKFILSNLLSSSQFALYFNATLSIPFISLIFGAISNAGLMQLSRETDVNRQVNILHEMGKLLATIAFACFFFFSVFSREVFMVVFSAKYLTAVSIFICTLLALPARAYNFTALLQIHSKGHTINKGVLIDAIIAIVFFIPLYFLFGLKGVALSFVLGTYVQAAYYLVQTAKLINKPVLQLIPLRNWLLKFFSFGTFILILHALLTHFLNEKQSLLAGCLATGCLGAFILWREGKRNA